MRKFLNFLLVVLIIGVICVIAYGAIYLENPQKDITVSSNQENKNNTLNNNSNNIDSKKEQNKTQENEEKLEDDKKEIEIEKENDTEKKEENNVKEENKNEQVDTKEEVNVSDEEKAINLAKKQYGNTNGVYFRVEQIQSNNVYIVSVRDSETTRDLAWYTIDVKNGIVK